jgi:RNA polymerase sigma-70 factor (ECF subfamily)
VDSETIALVNRWREGDERAADDLFHRYVDRLLALARSRLSEKLAARFDPEDVVQSAYRSFFDKARSGRFTLERSGELWRLLAAITINKLHHAIERNTAGKRGIDQERGGASWLSQLNLVDMVARDPRPSEAVALADEMELLMRDLAPLQRRMLELKLRGFTLEEIAVEVQRSERTVRRVMDQVKQILELRFKAELAT